MVISLSGKTLGAETLQKDLPDFTFLSLQSTTTDILEHPAFGGFPGKLLPWDNRRNDNVSINRIGQLMPYHSNVRPEEILGSLNELIKNVREGKQIFYNIYPEGDRRRLHTGLFFFRGRPGAPFAVVCPGGGFAYVGTLHEGLPVAQKISRAGYNAFVLKYRAGSAAWAMQDLAQALGYIFQNAETLGITTDNYSLWGGSAGARMVAYAGSYGTAAFGGADLPRPSAVVMAYTGHGDFSKDEPPTFMIVGENDPIADPVGMRRRSEALNRAGIYSEFYQYPDLGHGFGTGFGTSAASWMNKAVKFWQKYMKKDYVKDPS